LQAAEAIDNKAGTRAYGLEEDSEDSEGSEVEIIEERETKPKGAKVKAEKTVSLQGPKVSKAFKVSFDSGEASPLANKPPRRNNQLNSATNAFGQMSEYFSPAAAQEREATKLASALELQRFGTLERSVQRLEEQNSKLQDQLQTKTMEFQQKLLEAESRATRAETELRLLNLTLSRPSFAHPPPPSRRRYRDYYGDNDDEFEDYDPRPSRRFRADTESSHYHHYSDCDDRGEGPSQPRRAIRTPEHRHDAESGTRSQHGDTRSSSPFQEQSILAEISPKKMSDGRVGFQIVPRPCDE
jgi:hypothetical protein